MTSERTDLFEFDLIFAFMFLGGVLARSSFWRGQIRAPLRDYTVQSRLKAQFEPDGTDAENMVMKL